MDTLTYFSLDKTYDFNTEIADAIMDKLIAMTKLKRVQLKSINVSDKPKPKNHFNSTGNS